MKSQQNSVKSPAQISALLLIAGLAALNLGYAQTTGPNFGTSGNAIDDSVLYHIGGGVAVPMSHTGQMSSIGVGAGWQANLICGNMSLTTTLKNQLNGATIGFRAIMSTVVQAASAAVASLPALIIQRADPALYNLLTNGVLQARLDYDRSKLTCRAMANQMADIAGGQLGWNQLAEGMSLQSAIGSGDGVAAIQTAEETHGNNGVPWIGGNNAGGAAQDPIHLVADVTRAGTTFSTDGR